MADPALLVGGVQKRLSVLQSALNEAGWKVHTSLNPKEALERLKAYPYAAVFCDAELKGASVPGLLTWARRLKPNTPFYLFDSDFDPSKFKMSGEPDDVLEYPPIAAHIPISKGTLPHEERFANAKTPLSGNTSSVVITDVIEMLGMTGQTSTIEFDFGKTGIIYMSAGKLEHAVCYRGLNPSQGLKALAFLVNLPKSEFRVSGYQPPKRATIRMPASTALTEAARIADEERRLAGFVARIRKICPEVKAAAIGYALSNEANQGFGQADDLFRKAKALLEHTRQALGSKINSVFVTTDGIAYVVVSFNEGNIIAACAPVRVKATLTKAVWNTVSAAQNQEDLSEKIQELELKPSLVG